MSLLQVRDLHVWFDLEQGGQLHAVQGLSLDLDQRELVGLVGESGCRKTTTMLTIMGLLPPSATVSGRVLFDGKDLLAGGERGFRSQRWKDIAIVFQGSMNAFNPVQTVGKQIAEPMERHGTATGRAATRRTAELLELVGIPASAGERYPHQFSGGMRQRAAIAMALACAPKVLLADEPTTALDVMIQAQIVDLLVALTREVGLSLLMVTHDLPLVAQTCQRAAVMYAGQIVESGPVQDLYNSPRHPYTRLLFAASPSIHHQGAVASIPGSPPALDRPVRGCAFEPRCDRAFALCREEPPLLLSVGAGVAACHLNGDDIGDASAVASRPGPATTVSRDQPVTLPLDTGTDPIAPLIEVRGLTVDYSSHQGLSRILRREPRRYLRAVDGVSLTVRKGQIVALIGESGCGKTTTALALLRMIEGASGSILLKGQDISLLSHRALKALRRHVQLTYQDPYESLDPRFRVRDTVEEPLLVHRVGGMRAQRLELVSEALVRAGLTPPDLYLNRYPHQLSGGERQRVAIAASLVLGPELLIADEPVSMLDVSVRAGILMLLNDLRLRNDLGILIITHDLSTAARFADRIAVMYLGRIVEEGSAVDVVNDPRHPYTRALLSVVPRADPSDRPNRQILVGETPDPFAIPSGCRFHPRCPVAETRCTETDPALHRPAGSVSADHQAACLLV